MWLVRKARWVGGYTRCRWQLKQGVGIEDYHVWVGDKSQVKVVLKVRG